MEGSCFLCLDEYKEGQQYISCHVTMGCKQWIHKSCLGTFDEEIIKCACGKTWDEVNKVRLEELHAMGRAAVPKMLTYLSRMEMDKEYVCDKDIEDLFARKSDLVDCGCKACRKPCSTIPGAFAPEEVLEFAKRDNNWTRKVFVDVFVDKVNPTNRPVMYLRPATVPEYEADYDTNTMQEQKGQCFFHGRNDKCEFDIVHRPTGCACYYACDKKVEMSKAVKMCDDDIKNMWDSERGLFVMNKYANERNKVPGEEDIQKEDMNIECKQQ